ncbi:MAG: carbon monoxide dehydrogenase accessory protein CooC [Spirochaetota bacterium]|nr:carbon monoxide dehydrogenase accessory protein CooC [Spirochaetota bacterium]
MKIAITGKGGVGKTSLSALLINHLAEKGKRVIAVDADPDTNLASALGFSDAEDIVPISEMSSLIEERTGAKPGSSGSFFKLNPKVDDLPEKLSKVKNNIRLMVMGTVKKGGSGCVCPESVLLKNLINHLVLHRDDVVIMDMEAGIEHLGRGTSSVVDALIVVVEPGMRSIETSNKIKALSTDLGINRMAIVGNKIRKKSDEDFIKENIKGIDIIGFIPFDDNLIESDMKGIPASSYFSENIEIIIQKIIYPNTEDQ